MPEDYHVNRFSDFSCGDNVPQVRYIPDFHAIKFNDDVTAANAAFFRRAALAYLNDLGTARRIEFEFFSQIEVDWLHPDAEPAAHHLPILDELRHDIARQVARNGKPNADVSCAERIAGGD